jgi:hypothetical protein
MNKKTEDSRIVTLYATVMLNIYIIYLVKAMELYNTKSELYYKLWV